MNDVVRINPEPNRLSELKAELAAIDLWDSDYYRAQQHEKIDDDSYRARQKRREKVLDEILRIVGADPRVFRLRFQ